jgi:hypothetical protein
METRNGEEGRYIEINQKKPPERVEKTPHLNIS